jgi:DNA-binding response OmpR family regulator
MTATDIVKTALGGARVLVAEGDLDDSVALTAVLRFNGFDAHVAGTEEEVLRRVSETRPAVLIVDLDLPGPDGCALIRRVGRLPDPPAVVVVTAHTAPSVRRAAICAGAAAYLLKPADPVELAKLVGQLCERQ